MTESSLCKTIFLAASRETVWRFLTEKDKLAKWFHAADADLQEHQDYALVSKADNGSTIKLCWGTVLEMNHPASMTWSFTIKPLNGEMTTVQWELAEAHGGTMLSLKHTGISQAAGDAALNLLMALDEGWDKHFSALRAVAS